MRHKTTDKTKQKKGTVAVRISADIHRAAKILAAQSGTTVRDIVDTAMREWLMLG